VALKIIERHFERSSVVDADATQLVTLYVAGAQRLFRSHAPVGQSTLDFRPREFSGVQLDEVVHADRLLACKLEQVVGHAVVAALLV
jgi:hypothetical protein